MFTLHLTHDIVRGIEPGTFRNLSAVPIAVVWLYGTLVLAERRSGYVFMFLLSLVSLVIPVLQMMGEGVGARSRIANSSGASCFIWTLLAVGVTALFSAVRSVRGLSSLRQSRSH